MVVLKKIKSASLVEAIVASVLIVIVYIVSSLILNNLVLNTYTKNIHSVENRFNELEYEIQNGLIKFPYQENYNEWDIKIKKEQIDLQKNLLFLAINKKTNKEITRQYIYVEK